MKMQHLLLTICLLLCIYSCELPAIGKEEPETSLLLTGESLANTKLSYVVPEAEYHQVKNDRFIFTFKVDLSDNVKVKENNVQYNVIPSDELFSSFGSNKRTVRNEYERIHKEVCDAFLSVSHTGHYSFNVITILYNGGISLICDSEFAGHAAGENLASIIIPKSGENPMIAPEFNTPSNVGKCIEMPMEYICLLSDVVSFSIPMGDYELLHTGANFRLEIPVRVVDYLTWLNDKISDPNAEMPYRDEVLTCSFRTNWTLR